MLGKIAKVLLIILLLLGIAYFGACAYMNFVAKPPAAGQVKMPDAKEAPFAVTIADTGTMILTANYETLSDTPGSRCYVLHGYWEVNGQEYRNNPGDITLNEQVFGDITIKRRTVSK